MQIVIADSSCLVLFTNIVRLEILDKMFSTIWVTAAISHEYGLRLPDWISIHNPVDGGLRHSLSLILDPGEASSIALAVETPNSRIIIDERNGRRIALSLGLEVVGTLGILMEASKVGLIVADKELLNRLDLVGFRLSRRLKERLISGE